MDETIVNLIKAYIGESLARNRYTCYAKIAKQEGYEQISEIFLLTAENEREHAKWLFYLITELKNKYNIEGNSITVNDVEVPTVLGNTAENLMASIEGEHFEHTEMYPKFAEIAEKEGLNDVAERLRAIAIAENHHENRFNKLLKEVENGTVFKKNEPVEWVCRKCGYTHEGNEPPKECSSCSHPAKYFEILCEKY
ncbi:rubrerythrin [Methanococcus aeolicus]|jgi:rubrerythrin|uniref:Rubrerythrin n=1 Tax=Methanococcus aeolicus (strain ATCC BAA-1280 / DSM 17508 / OCM 812 / Nankai-3) TaxID=419665 RepID=A6UTU1_META3|nr:rubrerythrin family protein [Methanococcus aeolicus]ABR55913.1 Rubrerythrin [Methanococcus aeolicus Nankai-3]UXM85483.1 rubrerythrin family protein [Methanococcus aeolicus]